MSDFHYWQPEIFAIELFLLRVDVTICSNYCQNTVYHVRNLSISKHIHSPGHR